MHVSRALWATIACSAVLVVGGEAQQTGPPVPPPSGQRTWRAGGLEASRPDALDQGHDLCAALAPLEGLDLYVAVSRGEAKAGDVLVHLACGTRGAAASRAALIALAASGDRQDVQVLFEVAAASDPVRAADAVEALLLAGLPVSDQMVARAYRSSDVAVRKRLLVAMSAGAATDALGTVLEVETDEGLAREARRRLDAIR